jgi:hypothetical protein
MFLQAARQEIHFERNHRIDTIHPDQYREGGL